MTFFGDIQTIIQSGAVGIVLVLIYCGYNLGKQAMKIAANHLEHIAEALSQMNAKMDVLVDRTPQVGPRGRRGPKGEKGDPG
jgi:hypothetical protein